MTIVELSQAGTLTSRPSNGTRTRDPLVRIAPGIGRSARFVGRDALAPGAGRELVENQLVDRLVDRADAAVAVHEVDLTGMLAHPVRVVVDALDDDRLVEGAIGVGPDAATRGHGPVARKRLADQERVGRPVRDIGDAHARILIEI